MRQPCHSSDTISSLQRCNLFTSVIRSPHSSEEIKMTDNSGQDAAYGYPKQPFSGCRQQAARQQSRRKPANVCPQPCSLQPVNKNQSMNKTGIRIVYIFAKYTFII